MDDLTKLASAHFQILVFGTVVFLVVFFGFTVPVYEVSVIAGYLAFVVLTLSHGLLDRPT